MLFDIAIFQDDHRYLLQVIKVPVLYLIGGPKDIGYTTVSLPFSLPLPLPLANQIMVVGKRLRTPECWASEAEG
jgi:hypothetical protein